MTVQSAETKTLASNEAWELATPVVFFIFNRPLQTQRVFAEIAKARPPILFIIADGPRPKKSADRALCEAVRNIVNDVDWPCDVRRLYAGENLGCAQRISSGIDWVLGQVENAIFLEDDCLPEPSFFRFCEEMLIRYRTDQRVGMIAGSNYSARSRGRSDRYHFSNIIEIWGWATWRDRWQQSYDLHLSEWSKINPDSWLDKVLSYPDEIEFWKRVFGEVVAGKFDAWDYQWVFANWRYARHSIVPDVNLIKNIGFGSDATHTIVEDGTSNQYTGTMTFPLHHPKEIAVNEKLDRANAKRFLPKSRIEQLKFSVLKRLRLIFGWVQG